MSHDDFDFEPMRGLPAPLPAGEQLLWQGVPRFKSLALRAYHVRKVIIYFLALIAWRVTVGLVYSQPWHDVWVSCALLMVMGSLAVGVLCLLAYLSSRTTVYTITSRRVLLRHGIAVPMTMNLPFKSIDGAALKLFANGTGEVALTVAKNQRVGYLITWPHLRPGHITRPQPSFRALSDAERAARILGQALARDAGTVAVEPPSLRERAPSHAGGGRRSATPRTAVA
jgi:hypothetical protein